LGPKILRTGLVRRIAKRYIVIRIVIRIPVF